MPTHTILPQSCTSLGGVAYNLCLPPRRLCESGADGASTPTNATLISLQGEHWNCNTCQADEKYNIPYVKGDVIHIQTRFFDGYNTDRTNPTSGFGSFIVAVITDGVTRIPVTGMVAYGCRGSFQIVEIDTASIALDCWVVEYSIYTVGDVLRRTAQSQEYGMVSADECQSTILVRGQGRGTDCFGNCYEVPDAYVGDLISYNNAMRFWGSVHDVGGSFEKSDISGEYFASDVIAPYKLSLHRKIPPFAKNVLLRQLLYAPITIIDGETYNLESFSIDNQVKKGRMFLFSVELERKCNGTGC